MLLIQDDINKTIVNAIDYSKDKYTDLVIIDQFDKEHIIKYKEDEKIIWNTSFSLSSLVFNTK